MDSVLYSYYTIQSSQSNFFLFSFDGQIKYEHY